MADNYSVPCTGEQTFAADDISGVKHQRIKLGIGKDGEAIDLSFATPMPVSNDTLELILVELQTMNMHLSVITENQFDSGESF